MWPADTHSCRCCIWTVPNECTAELSDHSHTVQSQCMWSERHTPMNTSTSAVAAIRPDLEKLIASMGMVPSCVLMSYARVVMSSGKLGFRLGEPCKEKAPHCSRVVLPLRTMSLWFALHQEEQLTVWSVLAGIFSTLVWSRASVGFRERPKRSTVDELVRPSQT